MNVSKTRPPSGGFEDRLEAELVKVVTARARASAQQQQDQPGTRRWLAVRASVLAVTTAAVVAGLVFGGPLLSRRPAVPSKTGGGAGPVHISTAAFRIDTSTDGTVRLTWDKSTYVRDSRGFSRLQRALREAGIPVLIKEGVFCRGSHQAGQLDPSGVGPGVGRVMKAEGRPGGDVVFVFTPSAMPAGDELFIGYLSPAQLAITHGRPGSVERLVPTGGPLICTTQAPAPQSAPSPSPLSPRSPQSPQSRRPRHG